METLGEDRSGRFQSKLGITNASAQDLKDHVGGIDVASSVDSEDSFLGGQSVP
jgi:hypothetical protein